MINYYSLPLQLTYVLQCSTGISSWEEAATEQTQVYGFHVSLNLQEIFCINLREQWRSSNIFKLEAISNTLNS